MLRFGILLATIVIAADQASKAVILEWVMAPEPRMIEVTGFFNIVLVWNRGASFGLFGGGGETASLILLILAFVISAGLAVWLARTRERTTAAGLGLIIGGALGNAIDRIRFDAVVDFLDLHGWGFHWPAFNVADAAISVGVVLLLWESLFGGRESPK